MSYQTRNYSINCKGKLLNLSPPVVMGILNITPDSFFDGGKFTEESSILEKVSKLVEGGAQIIDIGGASSRPGASVITESEEESRILPVVTLLTKNFPQLILSVDTWRSDLAEKAILLGAHIINDISAGQFDPDMFKTVARLNAPYIMMHLQGDAESMHEKREYLDLLPETMLFFQERIAALRSLGVNDIMIDPGFGFSKSLSDNYFLLKNLPFLQQLDCPILVGVSRKSMINKVLHISPAESLNGTSVLNTIALLGGASILRVHDAKEANECIQLTQQLTSAE